MHFGPYKGTLGRRVNANRAGASKSSRCVITAPGLLLRDPPEPCDCTPLPPLKLNQPRSVLSAILLNVNVTLIHAHTQTSECTPITFCSALGKEISSELIESDTGDTLLKSGTVWGKISNPYMVGEEGQIGRRSLERMSCVCLHDLRGFKGEKRAYAD